MFYRYTRSAYCWKQEAQVDIIISRKIDVVIKAPLARFVDSVVVKSEDGTVVRITV